MSWWNSKEDASLYELLTGLPVFPFSNLVRPSAASVTAARKAFFTDGTPPIFSFPRANEFDVDGYLAKIKQTESLIEASATSGDIRSLYTDKLFELKTRAELIRAMQKKDAIQASKYARLLFGEPSFTLEEMEQELETICTSPVRKKDSLMIDAKTFAKAAEVLLKRYNMSHTRLQWHDGSSVKIGHTPRTGHSTVYIPEHLFIDRGRAARVLTHEIEIHALRAKNAQNAPLAILMSGLDNYIETEEGLALYYQKQLLPEGRDPGFWEAYTISLAQKYAFQDVFQKLLEAKRRIEERKENPQTPEQMRESAWNLCVRAYRGISEPAFSGVVYVRDHIYRSGLQLVRDAVNAHGETILPRLFAGRVALHHLDHMINLDLKGEIPKLLSEEVLDEISDE